MASVSLLITQGPYTGCSMNPVRTFAPAFWVQKYPMHWVGFLWNFPFPFSLKVHRALTSDRYKVFFWLRIQRERIELIGWLKVNVNLFRWISKTLYRWRCFVDALCWSQTANLKSISTRFSIAIFLTKRSLSFLQVYWIAPMLASLVTSIGYKFMFIEKPETDLEAVQPLRQDDLPKV